jgi:hypothetical protein
MEYIPTIDDLYPYSGKTDTDDDYFPLASDRQLMKYLEERLDCMYFIILSIVSKISHFFISW